MHKREEYVSWDEYFGIMALIAKLRSKDPTRQVGSIIVSKDKRILSVGYNGAPNGISDDDIPWKKEGNPLEQKYLYVVHAELNAILNYKEDKKELNGSTLYTSFFPCNECAKAIIQSGIKEIVYLNNSHYNRPDNIASLYLLRCANIKIRSLEITEISKKLVIQALLEEQKLIPIDEEELTRKLTFRKEN